VPKKYKITLTSEERWSLVQIVRSGKAPARTLTRARVLLKADCAEGQAGRADAHVRERARGQLGRRPRRGHHAGLVPGRGGGTAVADVLFGDYNPAGRLPVTFYKSVEQLPPFESYAMEGRTYRFFKGQPLYPFGHGLSYTRFKYSGLKVSSPRVSPAQSVTVSATVENAGRVEGDEVVQLYVTDVEASVRVPVSSLAGVERVRLKPGEKREVSFTVDPRQLAVIRDDGRAFVEPGEFRVSVGGKQPGFAGSADAATTSFMEGHFTVVGAPAEVKR